MKPIATPLIRIVRAGFIIAALAPAAQAQGINLAWRNCIAINSGATSAIANINYACDGSSPAPFKGVMSFIAPTSLTHFVGMQAMMDIHAEQPVLPDYWRLGIGECREGSFVFPASLLGIGNTASCRNPWSGATTSGGFHYTSEVVAPYRARVLLAFARDTETTLTAGQQYIAGAFTIDTQKDVDVGDGQCTGCVRPACLVLQQIELYQTAGQLPPEQDIYVLSTPATRAEVYWQAAGFWLCVTSAKHSSWGRIKATYR